MLLRNHTSRRSGATLVEFAAVCVVLTMIVFGIVEYCLIVYTTNIVENAAREGSRYAVVNVTDTTMVQDTKDLVKSYMFNLDTKMTAYNCDVYRADANGNYAGVATDAKFGEYVCVEVKLDYVPMTPGLLYLKKFTIRSKSSMGSEAN